jgi:TonB family protein
MLLHETGKVTEVEVAEKSICDAFDKSAMKAARKIKFTPAREGGVAVSKYVTIEYSYSRSTSVR